MNKIKYKIFNDFNNQCNKHKIKFIVLNGINSHGEVVGRDLDIYSKHQSINSIFIKILKKYNIINIKRLISPYYDIVAAYDNEFNYIELHLVKDLRSLIYFVNLDDYTTTSLGKFNINQNYWVFKNLLLAKKKEKYDFIELDKLTIWLRVFYKYYYCSNRINRFILYITFNVYYSFLNRRGLFGNFIKYIKKQIYTLNNPINPIFHIKNEETLNLLKKNWSKLSFFYKTLVCVDDLGYFKIKLLKRDTNFLYTRYQNKFKNTKTLIEKKDLKILLNEFF